MEIEWYSTSTYDIEYKYLYVDNFLINLEKLKINNYEQNNITND
tara:strand:- start:1052 stop:1183 length:132 start_codon:yes stop_codon:yes gene_type:complete